MEDLNSNTFTSDQPIVEGIRKGDPDAHRALFEKYAPWLMYTARRTGLVDQDAEEVVSDVIFRISQRIAAGTTGDNVGPLLHTATRNAAVSYYRENLPRRQHEVPAVESDPEDPDPGEPHDEGLTEPSEVSYQDLLVRQALAKLSPRDRQVLSYIGHDATNEEIAESLKTNPNHARQLRKRAQERLKEAVMEIVDGLPKEERQAARKNLLGKDA